MPVQIGLEYLVQHPHLTNDWGACGLLINQASVDGDIRPAQLLLKQVLGDRLKVLFSPQHGLFADKQDDMIESGHGRDVMSGLPFFSLYSDVREPTDSMMEGIDSIVVDIQDVGTRVYTFIYTMAGVMRVCARLGKKVIVLDRPNPIGGVDVEGNVLDEDSKSFVGEYPLPMRHGMTVGELARWFKNFFGIGVHLEVIPMKGWERTMHFRDTGRTWVMTSPNMPTADTCELYPGMVLLEGTNISEGRGTTLPFLMIGAPYLVPVQKWLDTLALLAAFNGIALRPTAFEPTFHKWKGETCWGVNYIVCDPGQIRSYRMGIAAIIASLAVAPEHFRFKDPPYEYEYDRPPIQLLLGSSSIPRQLQSIAGRTPSPLLLDELEEEWKPELAEFLRQRREVLMYRDKQG